MKVVLDRDVREIEVKDLYIETHYIVVVRIDIQKTPFPMIYTIRQKDDGFNLVHILSGIDSMFSSVASLQEYATILIGEGYDVYAFKQTTDAMAFLSKMNKTYFNVEV